MIAIMTREEFDSVWKDSPREDILNQFYYEHMEIERLMDELEWYKQQCDDLEMEIRVNLN